MATMATSNSTHDNTPQPVKGVTRLKPSVDAHCQKNSIGKFVMVNCGSEEGKSMLRK